MIWCGNAILAKSAELPLAIMESPCIFRDAALASLDGAGRSYRIVLETPSVAVLKSAVDGGLALTCRTAALIDSDETIFEMLGLPLPKVGFVMRSNPNSGPHILRLSALIRNAIEDLNSRSTARR